MQSIVFLGFCLPLLLTLAHPQLSSSSSAHCDSQYGVCFNYYGQLREPGPPAIVISRYTLPHPNQNYDIPIPNQCMSGSKREDPLWDSWCKGLSDILSPIHDQIGATLTVLKKAIADLAQSVAEQQGLIPTSETRRGKRFVWNLLRAIIPDGRLNAVENGVQTLLRQSSQLSSVQKDLEKKMTVVMEATDKRIDTLTHTFSSSVGSLANALTNLTTKFEQDMKTITDQTHRLDLKVTSLADVVSISNQLLINLISAHSSLNDFRLGIQAMSSRVLTPVLIPPDALIKSLHAVSSTLLETDYQLLYPPNNVYDYYSAGLKLIPYYNPDTKHFLLVFPAPTVMKVNNYQLLTLTGFDYPIPVQVDAHNETLVPALFRLHSGFELVAIMTSSASDSVFQANRIASVNTHTLKLLAPQVYTTSNLIWVSPAALSTPNCLLQAFSFMVSGLEFSSAKRDALRQKCSPVMKKVSSVQLSRVNRGEWIVIANLQGRFSMTVHQTLGPEGLPARAGQIGVMTMNNPQACKVGCTVRLKCGMKIHIEHGRNVWETSVEHHDCDAEYRAPINNDITTVNYYSNLSEIIVPNFTAPSQSPYDNTALTKIRENLEFTKGQIEQFKQTDDEISIQVKTTISDVKTLQINLRSLREHMAAENARISKTIEDASWGTKIYRIISGVFLIVTVAVTIMLCVKLCFPKVAAAFAFSRLPSAVRGSFIMSTDPPFRVAVINSIWSNPDLWGVLIGMALLILVGAIFFYCWCRARRGARAMGYHGPSDIVFNHMGALIQTQVPKLAGYQLPPVRDIPKLVNLAMKYPTIDNPKCLVQVWVEYILPKVGKMSFMTAVGTFNCEDRPGISSTSIKHSEVKLTSPGKSTLLEGYIAGIEFVCSQRVLTIDQCPIKLSIPPEITNATFRINGLALTCERCGYMWLAADIPSGSRNSSRPTPGTRSIHHFSFDDSSC